MELTLDLKVSEAQADDIGKGLARLNPDDIKALNGVLGDVIEITGGRTTVARITGTLSDSQGMKAIQIDGLIRDNAKASPGSIVKVRKVLRKTATTVVISPVDFSQVLPEESDLEHFAKILQGLAVIIGDKINIPFLAGKERFFQIEATSPSSGVIVNQKTTFVLKRPDFTLEESARVSYDDIGGLERELRLIREMVELPLRYAEVFERLGIEAPRGCSCMVLRGQAKHSSPVLLQAKAKYISSK